MAPLASTYQSAARRRYDRHTNMEYRLLLLHSSRRYWFPCVLSGKIVINIKINVIHENFHFFSVTETRYWCQTPGVVTGQQQFRFYRRPRGTRRIWNTCVMCAHVVYDGTAFRTYTKERKTIKQKPI